MPVNETLPIDIERRLANLGEVIAAATPDVDFAYLFGSAVTGGRTRTVRLKADTTYVLKMGAIGPKKLGGRLADPVQ